MVKKRNKGPDTNTMAVLVHVLGLVPLFNIIGQGIVMLTSVDRAVKNHARNALNWELTLLIYLLAAGVIASTLIFLVTGTFLYIALWVLNTIFCIVAAIKAGSGELWRYPASFQFFRQE